jgi:hypothetical protein
MEHKDIIVKGVSSAFRLLESKGVVQSFDVLTSCYIVPFSKRGIEEAWKF